MQDQDTKVSYSNTLNLPKTDFPIRPNHLVDDSALREQWKTIGLINKVHITNQASTAFVLHDGPPYANGDIHLGHAYNKILKDIIAKSHRMMGYQVRVTPGWDCHGLPIELKVTKQDKTRQDIMRDCRVYAQGWVDIQREQFKELGVLFDWDNPYKTMDYSYESATVKAFAALWGRGYIIRKNKAVAWCASCQTTLASAEIEYKDRKDPSIYCRFDVVPEACLKLQEQVVLDPQKPISCIVWTTTPWTLPLNRALMIHPQEQYVVLDMGSWYGLLGQGTYESFKKIIQQEPVVLGAIAADVLHQVRVIHPFVDGLTVPIVTDLSVGLTEGTAIVHTAPGCGPIDYEVGIKNKLEIFSPVTDAGFYTDDVAPQELVGKSVADGQGLVIKMLSERNMLVHKGSINHSYPHCWRCHQGLIFRATPQWFINLEHENLRERALFALDTIIFNPRQGRSFLQATVSNRTEWCISRQRVWGVPIPALLCSSCKDFYSSPELFAKVIDGVAREGVEFWDRVDIKELIGETACLCGARSWEKERDILDVWFDSGVSHTAVLAPVNNYPATYYVEGIDQYRGWFQSSLLTGIALYNAAPMRGIVAHGFTVDERGNKMSKSLGNVVPPSALIEKIGIDGLRLWVASVSNDGDAVVSSKVLDNVAQVYRKIRNTLRFLLQNLNDYNHAQHACIFDNMHAIDRYALRQLYMLNYRTINAYKAVDITSIFHGLAQCCANDLSSFYVDIVKDRLYVEAADSASRRAVQTVLWYHLDTLLKICAPILSFMVDHIKKYHDKSVDSVHILFFNKLDELASLCGITHDHVITGDEVAWFAHMHEHFEKIISESATYKQIIDQWALVIKMREGILKAIEQQRATGVIKHSLEAKVTLCLHDGKYFDAVQAVCADAVGAQQTVQEFFKEICIVSQVVVNSSADGLEEMELKGAFVGIQKSDGVKCPRCWNYTVSDDATGLCVRCKKLVEAIRMIDQK
jgi:isoleucyl-tRNA synthetase